MPNFAVLDGESVLNTIIADSKAIAEEITGKTCVEFTTENAEPGGLYSNGIFIQRKPYPSWLLNENNNWEPPIPKPAFEETPVEYMWNEDILDWVVVTPEL